VLVLLGREQVVVVKWRRYVVFDKTAFSAFMDHWTVLGGR